MVEASNGAWVMASTIFPLNTKSWEKERLKNKMENRIER
jgi:hypothetical protein